MHKLNKKQQAESWGTGDRQHGISREIELPDGQHLCGCQSVTLLCVPIFQLHATFTVVVFHFVWTVLTVACRQHPCRTHLFLSLSVLQQLFVQKGGLQIFHIVRQLGHGCK